MSGEPRYHVRVQNPELNAIVERGESFMLRKHDVSTTVGIVKGRELGLNPDVLIKRFNDRGVFDFLIHTFSKGRARRLWDINVRLYQRGLPVPEPVAYTEPLLRDRVSFHLSVAVENAEKLSTRYREGLFRNNRELLLSLARTIAEWHLKGAVHGDLKWPNILVQEKENGYVFFFIDLDQSRLYSAPCTAGMKKDLKRFCRFGLEMGAESWVESEFFPAYLSFLPEQIRKKIDPVQIRNEAHREWIRKGSKKW